MILYSLEASSICLLLPISLKNMSKFIFLLSFYVYPLKTWKNKNQEKRRSKKLRGCLVCIFKQPFLVFKQHFTYFYTFFHSHIFLQIFSNNNFQFLNTTLNFFSYQKKIWIFFFNCWNYRKTSRAADKTEKPADRKSREPTDAPQPPASCPSCQCPLKATSNCPQNRAWYGLRIRTRFE